MSQPLDYIVQQPQGEATAAVIWCHGLGDSGDGFAPVVPALKLPKRHGIRFLFPHAPVRPITVNGGMAMRAWYDIKSMDLDKRADITGVLASEQQLNALIDDQIAAGIPAERIILVGFSQGGVMSLYTGLRCRHRLAGIVGLSCYLANADLVDEGRQGVNADTPLFLSHGSQDMMVPFAAGQQGKQALQQAGFTLEWHSYPMEHWVCEEQLATLGQWMSRQLGL